MIILHSTTVLLQNLPITGLANKQLFHIATPHISQTMHISDIFEISLHIYLHNKLWPTLRTQQNNSKTTHSWWGYNSISPLQFPYITNYYFHCRTLGLQTHPCIIVCQLHICCNKDSGLGQLKMILFHVFPCIVIISMIINFHTDKSVTYSWSWLYITSFLN